MNKSIFDVVHESAKGLHDAGLMDVKTMHTFDAMCLPLVHKLSPKQNKSKRSPNKAQRNPGNLSDKDRGLL